jgi:hypothetical protein
MPRPVKAGGHRCRRRRSDDTPDLDRLQEPGAFGAHDVRGRALDEEHLRAVGADALELLFRNVEPRVVRLLELAIDGAGVDVAAIPEILDEGIAVRIGLECQESVELVVEKDRLDITQEVLIPDLEFLDPGGALALRQLANAVRVFLVFGFRFRGRFRGCLGENVGGKDEGQGSGERFHGFSEVMRIYLDNNATTAIHPRVLEVLEDAMREIYGNASSIHREGQTARRVIEDARESVARLIGATARELVFTSGGPSLTMRPFLGGSRGWSFPHRHNGNRAPFCG